MVDIRKVMGSLFPKILVDKPSRTMLFLAVISLQRMNVVYVFCFLSQFGS